MMKTMLSTLMTITIVALTARPSIVLTLPLLCAGATAANCPEIQNPAPVQQPAGSPSSGQAADAKPEGDWEGTLAAGPAKIRIVLHITRKEGAYGARWTARTRVRWESQLRQSPSLGIRLRWT